MASKEILFHGFSGINNSVKQTKIGISENAVAGLSSANNVFIGVGGTLETVPEEVISLSGSFHSLWGLKDKFYCVKDETASAVLYCGNVLNGALSMRTVAVGLSKGSMVSYTKLGEDIYYSNGIDKGYIDDNDVRFDWPIQHNSRLLDLVTFTPGSHIDVLAGRMLSINGDEIRFSESFLPGLYDDVKNRRRLNSAGQMVCSVGSGAYVSDEDYVYFLTEVDPNKWKLKKVLDYPAIAYGQYPNLVDPSFFGFQTRQPSLLFNTQEGVCIGMPSGEVYNLTHKRYHSTTAYEALTIFDESLVILSNADKGILVQGMREDVGNKPTTEWDGGFNSLFTNTQNEVICANELGLFFLWGQDDPQLTGLEMLSDLEMLSTLEMI